MADTTATSLVRGYYESIDAPDYDRLAELLAPDFVQHRGDRTIDGRDEFVRFMREERPNTDTTHEVDAVFESGELAVVLGRLMRADGSISFGFADAFTVKASQLSRLVTYSNARVDRDVTDPDG